MNASLSRTAQAALLLLSLALLGLGGCAPAHIGPEPLPTLSQGNRSPVVAAARSLKGIRYKWGGESPKTGFDCSGLTWWSYRQVGVDLPRTTDEQFETGLAVGRRDLRPGDLVFFRLNANPKNLHVGIVTGPQTFIHSPRQGGRVREDPLDAPFWRERYMGARRVVRQDG